MQDSFNKVQALKKELKDLESKKSTAESDKNVAASMKQDAVQRKNAAEKEMAKIEKNVNTLPQRIQENQKKAEDLNLKLKNLEAKAQTLTERLQQHTNKQNTGKIAEDKVALEKLDLEYERTLQEIEANQKERQKLILEPKSLKSSSRYQQLSKEVQQATQDIVTLRQEETNYSNVINNTQNDINKKNKELQKQSSIYDELKQKLRDANTTTNSGKNVADIRKELSELLEVDISKIPTDLKQLNTMIEQLQTGQLDKVRQSLEDVEEASEEVKETSEETGKVVNKEKQSFEDFDSKMSDVSAIKSRIEYFFGLQNAIQIVKRAMHDAYQTVKDLDKVMTETAVVTDFSVGDMWAQLPDYTKRANELGVSTQAAYEAATLYYQQGLKTNEVVALSNETLKMARIAGLEAAEATDRMTNAIRGFNMEINETNAQRIDDVYSRLAAVSASNVDEISTAMTKVASLANNANMEFETTAAFLAQIIETTRESAETAGTALKTVVARFSEVKELFNKGDLTGQDEEGEVIDVNKIGAALRTAGVDLNKYFLGEVGLDDIFMELASKWDGLTKLQQRYIATQAAGSRQQSRFIALMSDYARTQELVGEAYNSNGAAAEQFAKTQESLESKLARLTNAWHEFTMGIANSTVIKAGVDLLTKILNIVNEITSGFGKLQGTAGGVVTSILKLGALSGGLWGGKKLIEKGTQWMGTHSVGLWGRIARTGLSDTARNTAETAASQYVAGGGKGLIGTAIGKLVGVAGGVGPLAGYIAAATAAAGLAYIAIKKVYDLTPAGQVKVAEKWAQNLENVSDKLQSQKKALTDIQKNYQDYTEKIDNSQTINDRQEAIKSRNEYIKSLLEQDATYIKYIKELKDDATGQIILTIDEEALANAVDIIAQGASRGQAGKYFGQAMLAQKQAAYQQSKITYSYSGLDTYSTNERIRANLDEDETISVQYVMDNTSQNILRQQEAEKYKEEAQYYAELGVKELLTKQSGIDDLSTVTINNLGEAIAKGINFSTIADKYQDQIDEYTNFFSGTVGAEARDALRAEYQSIYGTNPEEAGLSMDEIRQSIAAYKVFTEKQEEASQKTIELLAGERGEQYSKALEMVFGEGLVKTDFSEGGSSLRTIAKASGLAVDEIIYLIQALGYTQSEFTELADNAKIAATKIQQTNRAKIFESMLRNGNDVNKATKEYIESLTLQQQSQIGDILTNLQPFMSQETMTAFSSQEGIQRLLSLDQEEFNQINSFFSNFDLEDPINAFNKFIEAKNQAADGSVFSKLLEETEKVNKAILNSGTVFRAFFESSEYDDLTEDLDKFIEENKKISADKINELAKSSKALSSILKTGTVTANGLAKALTGIKTGNASIEGITERVLEAISTTDQFEQLLASTKATIEGFEEGRDLTDASNFYVEKIDKLLEEFNAGRIGNEPTENIWNLLFGGTNDQNYRQWLSSFDDNFDAAQADLQNRVGQLRGWMENESYGFMKEFAGSFGITDLGGGDFDWDLSAYHSLEEVLDDIQEKAKVTKEVAEALFQGYAAHSLEIQQQLSEWDKQNILEKLASSDTWSISTDELEALVAVLGDGTETADEFLENINKVRKASGKPMLIQVKWADDEGNPLTGVKLKQQWYEFIKGITDPSLDETKLNELTSTDLVFDERFSGLSNYADKWSNQLVAFLGDSLSGKQIDIDKLYHLFSLEGIPESQWAESADFLIGKLNSSLDGNDKKYEFVKTLIKVGADGRTALDQVTGPSAKEILASYERALETENYDAIAEAIATGIKDAYKGDITPKANLDTIRSTLDNFFSNYKPTIDVQINTSGKASSNSKIDNPSYTRTALGDFINQHPELSYMAGASGGQVHTTEFSLTGEEGPEIVWNKKGGYSYIAGANGPEFLTLYPGDQVFNAQDTARIFKNSGLNNKFGSHANGFGSYRGDYVDSGPEVVEAVEEAAEEVVEAIDEDEPIEWRNEFDWLYNLVEDINELERKQTRLAEQHDRYLKDTSKTGRDLYNLTNSQLSNLYTQYNNQSAAYQLRLQQMQEQLAASGLTGYINWNAEGSKLNIDWDAIEALTDKDLYDKINNMASTAEKIQSQIEEADDAMWKIEGEIEELQNRYRSAYIDLEKRVFDALVQSYQDQIDELNDIDEAINNTNESILNALQEEIALSRQIKDNTDTENNIREMEARLAYLQRDTTGVNQNEIRKLEKQLLEARSDYEDKLVDQSIDRLKQQNEDAAKQRENNISILTEQLEYWQEMGTLWPEVANIINNGLSGDGALVTGSKLEQILRDSEGWRSMSETQREVWAEELISATNQAGAYLLQLEFGLTQIGEDVTAAIGSSSLAATKYWDEKNKTGVSLGVNSTLGNTDLMARMLTAIESGDYATAGVLEKLRNMKIEDEDLSKLYPKTYTYSNYMAGREEEIDPTIDYMANALAAANAGNWSEAFRQAGMRDTKIAIMPNSQYAQDETYKILFRKWYDATQGKRFASGGLVTSSGLSWLDGSFGAPEYVLNARQTEAFLKLANFLPEFFKNGGQGLGGDLSVEVNVNVSQISSDYDVDQLVNRVKTDIYNAASYRNVNTISRLR